MYTEVINLKGDDFSMSNQPRESILTKVTETREKMRSLDSSSKDILDAFKENLANNGHNVTYQCTLHSAAVHFLDYVRSRDISTPGGITHRTIFEYYRDDQHDDYKKKDKHNVYVRKFLHFLSERGLIRASVPFTLDKVVLSHLNFIESLPPEIQCSFNENDQSICMCADDYYRKTLELRRLINEHNYSKGAQKVFRQAWKELFIFLEANSLKYNQSIALAWSIYMSRYTSQWMAFRRAMMLFEQYRSNGYIAPQTAYSYKQDRAELLPEWFRTDYDEFMNAKRKEGFTESALKSFKYPCIRFLEHLDIIGIRDWGELTPETIKEFHRQSPHSTPEARNAYSSRIRRFLEHLGVTGRVYPTLFMAMPCENAPRMSLIKTLNDDEIAIITKYQNDAAGAYELRNAAIILIGLRMGLRASDIAGLKLSDVSWEQEAISVMQQKTSKFLKLPMPIEVGNAIYRYIIHGRPSASSEYIFITHRVPFDRLNENACQRALKKALRDKSQGFHVTRKTFATRMLIENVGTTRIAETLGHVNNSSVMKYLSTNDEKMRMCTLSLKGIPVSGGALA